MTEPSPEQRAVSGKAVVLIAVLGSAVAMFFVTWLSLRIAEPDLLAPLPPLDWTDRANWPTAPVKFTEIDPDAERGPFEGRGRKALDFSLPQQMREGMRTLSAAASRLDHDKFNTEEWAETLGQMKSGTIVSLFYLDYLGTATSHDNEFINDRLVTAFAEAPKAVILRFVTPAGEPIPNLRLDNATLINAMMQDRVIDDSVRLVYPLLATDELGQVYLPAYDTVLRFADLPQPLEGDAVWPTHATQWFEFPQRAARFPDIVVRKLTPVSERVPQK